ncbi:MAG TPA: T9SS type A sorting domain-containing protein, partial [Cyclobacteriaceae bacterium]|nr:T9SS type A sorting domain-containing protein [Cyclobacteriaceae bacterium]
VGDAPFSLNASSTSNLPVVYTSSNLAVATISGNTVTITGGGTTTISATQPGNTFYNAATPVPQQLVVSKLPQTITFAALTNKVFGDPAFALTGSSSSNLAVGFSTSDPAVATIAGSTVTITGAGTVQITASQPGDNFYVAAAPVVQTLVVNKANQVITFSALPDKKAGDAPFALTGTSTSGLTISYASSNTAVATISGQTVTVVGAGSTQITASQSGNTNYNAATSVVQTLNVTAVTGLETVSDGLLAFPNPVESQLQLRLPRPGTVQKIQVLTMEGRTLVIRETDQDSASISFAEYTPGIFVIIVTTPDAVYRTKVAKK